jgi:hypothetical protein
MTQLQLPRRIILSRKGVDSSAGGFPSLICDERLLSIPIPETEFDHRVTYEDLPLPPGPWAAFENMGNLVHHVSQGRLGRDHPVHRDPDIRPELHANANGCRRTLGQCCRPDAALAHVEKGDLFLLFGWFARAAIVDQTVRRREEEHTVWGWLQTDTPARRQQQPQEPPHPHEYPRGNGGPHAGNRNSLYEALPQLTFAENVAGCGAFTSWNNVLRLTHPACRQGCRSLWRLPRFFYQQFDGIGSEAPWTLDNEFAVVQVVGQRQEYIFKVPEDEAVRAEINDWLTTLPW